MSKVPAKDELLLTFMQTMTNGIKNNSGIFPNPSIDVKEMDKSLEDCTTADDKISAAKSAYDAASKNKKDTYKNLHDIAVPTTAYCYQVAKGDKSILALVGLEKKTKSKPQLPGQCFELHVVKQGEGSADLEFKTSNEGSARRAYILVRRETGKDLWEYLDIVMTNKVSIENQPLGKSFEFRVFARNKTGDGTPSNTIVIRF